MNNSDNQDTKNKQKSHYGFVIDNPYVIGACFYRRWYNGENEDYFWDNNEIEYSNFGSMRRLTEEEMKDRVTCKRCLGMSNTGFHSVEVIR